MKLALGIEYEGTQYHGWQEQTDRNTVQASVEQALSQVAEQPIKVVCSGRTDAHVHACAQVVHFDVQLDRPDKAWVMGTNRYLPDDIRVQWVKHVPDDFHARYSALTRHYRYLIYNHATRPAIFSKGLTWCYHALDEELMAQGAKYLLGTHDFSAFRASSCQAKTPVRTIYEIGVRRHENYVVMDVAANAFLQHMIRNIAGVLMAVGQGKQRPEWVLDVLEAKNRNLAEVTAPPDGLYLINVQYPATFELPVFANHPVIMYF